MRRFVEGPVEELPVRVAEPGDSLSILKRSCSGLSDGGAGGGRSVMATSGMISVVFLGLTWSARRGGKSAVTAGRRFFFLSPPVVDSR